MSRVRLVTSTPADNALASFARLALLLEQGADMERVAHLVVEIAVGELGAEAAELRIFEDPGAPSRRLASAGASFPDAEAAEAALLQVRDSGGWAEMPVPADTSIGAQEAPTILVAPVSVSGRVVGVLEVQSGAGPFDRQQRDLLSLLVWMTSTTAREIQRDMLSRTLDAVRQIAETAGGHFEPLAVAQVVMVKAAELLRADSAGMAWWDGTKLQSFSHLLAPELTPGWSQEEGPYGTTFRRLLEPGQGALGLAYSTGRAVVVPDYRNWEHRLDEAFGSALAVPLLIQGEPTGALIVRYFEPREIPRNDVGLLTLLAAQVAPAMEAARLSGDLIESEITLRKTTEANQLKSEFMSVMSHELRTPLSAIIGFSELILSGTGAPLEPGVAEDVAEINRSGLSLLRLIEDILDFSKIESGKMEVEIEAVDLAVVVDEAVQLVTPLARSRGLQCELDLPGGAALARCDRRRTHQILKNLLSNAIKFTPEGTITAGLSRVGEEMEVYVTDTGVGIDAEARERIFDGFVQAEQTRTRQFGGLGLGLALVRNLVLLQGGRMGVESATGRGSRFWFRFPAYADESSEATLREAATVTADHRHHSQPGGQGAEAT